MAVNATVCGSLISRCTDVDVNVDELDAANDSTVGDHRLLESKNKTANKYGKGAKKRRMILILASITPTCQKLSRALVKESLSSLS